MLLSSFYQFGQEDSIGEWFMKSLCRPHLLTFVQVSRPLKQTSTQKKIQHFLLGCHFSTISSGTLKTVERESHHKRLSTFIASNLHTGALHVHHHGAHVGATWPVVTLVFFFDMADVHSSLVVYSIHISFSI